MQLCLQTIPHFSLPNLFHNMKKLLLLALLSWSALFTAAQNCWTDIYPYNSPNGATVLTTVDDSLFFDDPPVAYLWNTGEASQSIVPSDTGTYCVTVTYSSGCSAAACYYYGDNPPPPFCNAAITEDSTGALNAFFWNDAAVAYLWNTGETSPGIAPNAPGVYCVTITAASGCVDSDCVYFDGTGGGDSSQCDVLVEIWYWPDSTVQLHAATASGGAVFQWNTGQTGDVITITSAGYYCVSMTDANGCVATDCFLYGDTSCYAFLTGSWADTAIQLTVLNDNDWITYAWSTGAGTPDILVSEPGDYCVTVTNAAGCVATDCYFLPDYNNVYVWIQHPDSLDGILAEVFLIQYDTTQGGILTAVDTVQTDSSGYGFVLIPNVPIGQYLIKAALLPNAPHYGEYLPTYHGDVLFWNESTPIVVEPASNWNYGSGALIHLVEGQFAGGPGFIGGLVSEGANLTAGDEQERAEGDPMAGVSVILRRADDTPVAATHTAADGTFEFENLAWGDYKVSIDLPGIEPLHQPVNIGPDQPSADAVDFTVDGLSTSSAAAVFTMPAALNVRPNPVQDVLMIELPGGSGDLTLTNARGQIIARQAEQGAQALLDVRALPAGLYLLTLRSGSQTATAKIVKQ